LLRVQVVTVGWIWAMDRLFDPAWWLLG